MLAISIPAFLFADQWGRRASIITGGVGLSACMFIIGSLYAADGVHAKSGSGRWFVILLIFVFALVYCATWGIVGKIYASEIQPVQTRAAANSVAQGLNFVCQSLKTYMKFGLTHIAHELACCLCHADHPRTLILWCLFSVRRSVSVHIDHTNNIHARNKRQSVGRNRRRVPQPVNQ